jgi:hypothetical protein
MSDLTPSNAKELSAFQNAAVYEGLEKGKNLKTARQKASMAVQFSEQYLPNAQRALDVFSKSKIYDSIDVKGQSFLIISYFASPLG